jgi:exonuclease III
MKPKILSWNVRGLNNRRKRLRICNLLKDWKVDIICLQETKVKDHPKDLCEAYGGAIMWIGVWIGVGLQGVS